MKKQINKNNHWSEPIIKDGLLIEINPVDWQTITALAAYTSGQGKCEPSLEDLCAILGLADISSISKRIKKLKNKTFKELPVVTVKRRKMKNDKGVWVYSTNEYELHPAILAVFRIPRLGQSPNERGD